MIEMFTREQLLAVGGTFALVFVIIFAIDRMFLYKDKSEEKEEI